MNNPGYYTRQEILSQPEAWAAALKTIQRQLDELRAFYQAGKYELVLFTGCGSTYYLSLAAAALFQELTGAYARALPASEIWLYPQSAYRTNQQTLLVAVSRSGETTETLRAVEHFRDNAQGEVVTLSCYPGKPLTKLGSLNLVLEAGQENSIAQTRAFTVLYLATTALAALWSKQDTILAELEQLPETGRRILDNCGDLAKQLGQDTDLERFYFLGSGPRYGLACELSLKMKEMSLSHSEPFHFMEFRHGPQSMVTTNTLMIGLMSESNRRSENAVLDDMQKRGAHIFSLSEHDTTIAFQSSISEVARNILYLPAVQMMAYERSLSHGLDPDRPHNLDAVVRLDDGR